MTLIQRTEKELRLLCAFVGINKEQAPPEWWFLAANTATREAWKRVMREAEAIVVEELIEIANRKINNATETNKT